MAEFLLELFSEEIPARMQVRAAADLSAAIADRLKAASLGFEAISEFSGPRRIGLSIAGLAASQPDVSEEKKGPRVGSPDAAVQGFLKSAGLASLDLCEKRDTGKGEFWFAVIARKGRPTAEVLAEIVPEAIAALPWPKSMKWGAGETRWVRPLHSIICLFDGKVLPVSFGPVTASNTTRGHRFMAPAQFSVSSFADYRAKLSAARVEIDAAARRKLLLDEARKLAAAEGLSLVEDEGLANEVSGLVEWPVPLIGRIDDAFMDVPREVLTTSMRTHQKYFALNDAKGNLAARFIVVANNMAADGGKAIVAGNERVLRARLSDARFFWDQDRRHRLDARTGALKDIVFHAKLGTLAEKVARVERLAFNLAKHIPGCDAAKAKRAAHLAKADLVSGMVGEFPELQGIMGRYYAVNDGEDAAVAEAIAAHYSPLGPNDRCPTAPVSVAVALADKLDTLVGFFSIGEKPTGSKDPFALRRAALGIIRLIVENGLRIELSAVLGMAHLGYREQGTPGFMAAYREHLTAPGTPATGEVERHWNEVHCRELQSFLQDRLKVQSRDKGVRHDLISAVFAKNDEDLVRVLAKVDALGGFLKSADGPNLLTAYRRAANIVKAEQKKDKALRIGEVDTARLALEEEVALYGAFDTLKGASGAAVEIDEFQRLLAALAKLRAPVDAFFEKVTVNADDPAVRLNRLALCQAIGASLDRVADFSQIEG